MIFMDVSSYMADSWLFSLRCHVRHGLPSHGSLPSHGHANVPSHGSSMYGSWSDGSRWSPKPQRCWRPPSHDRPQLRGWWHVLASSSPTTAAHSEQHGTKRQHRWPYAVAGLSAVPPDAGIHAQVRELDIGLTGPLCS